MVVVYRPEPDPNVVGYVGVIFLLLLGLVLVAYTIHQVRRRMKDLEST